MSVWAEEPRDGGSAVWGCSTCDGGGWCWDHTTALTEARIHARAHGQQFVDILGGQGRGRPVDFARDIRIRELRAQKLTHQQIAELVGLTASGVLRALRRIGRTS